MPVSLSIKNVPNDIAEKLRSRAAKVIVPCKENCLPYWKKVFVAERAV